MPTFRARIGEAYNFHQRAKAQARVGGNAEIDLKIAESKSAGVDKPAATATATATVPTTEAKTGGEVKAVAPESKTAGETAAEAAAGRLSGCKCESPCTPRADGKSWCWLNQSCAGQPGTLKSTTGYYWRRCDPSRIASNSKITNGMVLDAYRALRVQADRLLTAPNVSPLLKESLLTVQRGLNGRITQLEAYFGSANVGMNPLALQIRNSIIQADASADAIRDVNAAQTALSNLEAQVVTLTQSLGILGNNPLGSGAAAYPFYQQSQSTSPFYQQSQFTSPFYQQQQQAAITSAQLLKVYGDIGVRIKALANSNRLSSADRSKLETLWKWAGDRYDPLYRFVSASSEKAASPAPANVFGEADRAMATLIDIEQRSQRSQRSQRTIASSPFASSDFAPSSFTDTPSPSEDLFEAVARTYPSSNASEKAYPEPVAFNESSSLPAFDSSFDSNLLSADEVASVWPEYAPPPVTLGML